MQPSSLNDCAAPTEMAAVRVGKVVAVANRTMADHQPRSTVEQRQALLESIYSDYAELQRQREELYERKTNFDVDVVHSHKREIHDLLFSNLASGDTKYGDWDTWERVEDVVKKFAYGRSPYTGDEKKELALLRDRVSQLSGIAEEKKNKIDRLKTSLVSVHAELTGLRRLLLLKDQEIHSLTNAQATASLQLRHVKRELEIMRGEQREYQEKEICVDLRLLIEANKKLERDNATLRATLHVRETVDRQRATEAAAPAPTPAATDHKEQESAMVLDVAVPDEERSILLDDAQRRAHIKTELPETHFLMQLMHTRRHWQKRLEGEVDNAMELLDMDAGRRRNDPNGAVINPYTGYHMGGVGTAGFAVFAKSYGTDALLKHPTQPVTVIRAPGVPPATPSPQTGSAHARSPNSPGKKTPLDAPVRQAFTHPEVPQVGSEMPRISVQENGTASSVDAIASSKSLSVARHAAEKERAPTSTAASLAAKGPKRKNKQMPAREKSQVRPLSGAQQHLHRSPHRSSYSANPEKENIASLPSDPNTSKVSSLAGAFHRSNINGECAAAGATRSTQNAWSALQRGILGIAEMSRAECLKREMLHIMQLRRKLFAYQQHIVLLTDVIRSTPESLKSLNECVPAAVLDGFCSEWGVQSMSLNAGLIAGGLNGEKSNDPQQPSVLPRLSSNAESKFSSPLAHTSDWPQLHMEGPVETGPLGIDGATLASMPSRDVVAIHTTPVATLQERVRAESTPYSVHTNSQIDSVTSGRAVTGPVDVVSDCHICTTAYLGSPNVCTACGCSPAMLHDTKQSVSDMGSPPLDTPHVCTHVTITSQVSTDLQRTGVEVAHHAAASVPYRYSASSPDGSPMGCISSAAGQPLGEGIVQDCCPSTSGPGAPVFASEVGQSSLSLPRQHLDNATATDVSGLGADCVASIPSLVLSPHVKGRSRSSLLHASGCTELMRRLGGLSVLRRLREELQVVRKDNCTMKDEISAFFDFMRSLLMVRLQSTPAASGEVASDVAMTEAIASIADHIVGAMAEQRVLEHLEGEYGITMNECHEGTDMTDAQWLQQKLRQHVLQLAQGIIAPRGETCPTSGPHAVGPYSPLNVGNMGRLDRLSRSHDAQLSSKPQFVPRAARGQSKQEPLDGHPSRAPFNAGQFGRPIGNGAYTSTQIRPSDLSDPLVGVEAFLKRFGPLLDRNDIPPYFDEHDVADGVAADAPTRSKSNPTSRFHSVPLSVSSFQHYLINPLYPGENSGVRNERIDISAWRDGGHSILELLRGLRPVPLEGDTKDMQPVVRRYELGLKEAVKRRVGASARSLYGKRFREFVHTYVLPVATVAMDISAGKVLDSALLDSIRQLRAMEKLRRKKVAELLLKRVAVGIRSRRLLRNTVFTGNSFPLFVGVLYQRWRQGVDQARHQSKIAQSVDNNTLLDLLGCSQQAVSNRHPILPPLRRERKGYWLGAQMNGKSSSHFRDAHLPNKGA